MVKVALFESSNRLTLEENMNEWFEKNPDINLHDIKYNSVINIHSNSYYSAMIIYRIAK